MTTKGKRYTFLSRLGPALALLVTMILSATTVLQPADELLQDWRFRATSQPASGETLFVEIDAQSLAQLGVWPWPRQIHAAVLDRLMELGAAEVVFDIDFSTASTEADDAAFAAALEKAGGYAYLAAFRQVTSDGAVVLNQPLDPFAAHAEALLVNVDGDGTGLLRSVPAGLPLEGIRSVAAALAPGTLIDGSNIVIDYGIDVASIDRISVSQLLFGSLDPATISNKQVIVGASAIELRDFFEVPRFGVIPGPLVQLAAVETLKSGHQLSDWGMSPALLFALLLTLVGVALGRQVLGRLLVAAVTSAVVVELVAWVALWVGHVSLQTAVFHVFAASCVLTTLLEERTARWRRILEQQARLAYLANHDAATDALSRQALLDRLSEELRHNPVSVVLVQLVGFDGVVGALGHDVGDRLAIEVTRRMQQQLGAKPARIANDVFAWNQPQGLTSAAQSEFCHDMSLLLEAPYAIEGHSVVLDTRFGSSVATKEMPAAEVLRQAEVALTEARGDKRKWAAYEASQGERISKRRLQDLALRQALEQREFFLLYQPQIDLGTGAMVGVEALVRWQSKTLGMVSPGDFIPLAEETGLIVALGQWILLEACREAARWDWAGRLSVNVSSVQFGAGDMVAIVEDALARSGFPADRLELEITESLFLENDPELLATLATLQQMGVTLALDDFGTGYSSLSYLSRLPVDKIKIDQSFIRPLPDAQSEAIVETIILMAKRLGKSLVAEGVETAEQRDYLASLGCETGQGYLFARPSSPSTLGLEEAKDAAA